MQFHCFRARFHCFGCLLSQSCELLREVHGASFSQVGKTITCRTAELLCKINFPLDGQIHRAKLSSGQFAQQQMYICSYDTIIHFSAKMCKLHVAEDTDPYYWHDTNEQSCSQSTHFNMQHVYMLVEKEFKLRRAVEII